MAEGSPPRARHPPHAGKRVSVPSPSSLACTIIPIAMAKREPALDPDDAFLRAFGERIRAERARRGMSRKLLAHHAGISERYITQIESGKGNISILLLRHVASALGLPLARVVEDDATSPELTLVRQFLARLSPPQLKEAHTLLASRFASDASVLRSERIALIGLRGAGKTTLGAALAKARKVPFFELDREIERTAGLSPLRAAGAARHPRVTCAIRCRHRRQPGLRDRHVRSAAAPLLHRLDSCDARGAHEPCHRPGGSPSDGRVRSGDGRPPPDPRRAHAVVCARRRGGGYDRGAGVGHGEGVGPRRLVGHGCAVPNPGAGGWRRPRRNGRHPCRGADSKDAASPVAARLRR
jgi:transcriptional regulator with XRE-family HTH domain